MFLQGIRRDRRLAQKQLAGLLEVDQSYLSGLESWSKRRAAGIHGRAASRGVEA